MQNEKQSYNKTLYDQKKNGYTLTNNTKVSGDYLEKHVEDYDKQTTIIYTRNIVRRKELPKTGLN